MTSAIARLTTAIDDLQKMSNDAAPAEAMLEEVRELGRQLARLESLFTRKVTAAHRAGAAAVQGFASTKAFLRHACRMSAGSAGAHVEVGIRLDERPAIGDDFAAGTISFAHVRAIADGLAPLPEQMQADAERVLLEVARAFDPARVHQAARRLRHIVDPDGQVDIDQRHYESRWVELAISYQGTGLLRGVLDPESAAVVRTALDALATPAGDIDPRTPAQRRADALVELAGHVLNSGELPEVGGERPHLSVNVDYASLKRECTIPAEMNDGGQLGVNAARRIACDAVVTRIVTAKAASVTSANLPTGLAAAIGIEREDRRAPQRVATPRCLDALPHRFLDALPPPLRGPRQILDVGRSARIATLAIRKALAARDKGCVMPGCDRPPSRCEAHHVIHWADGGVTALHNMVLLCSYHHHFVHEYGWRISINNDGTVSVRPPPARAA